MADSQKSTKKKIMREINMDVVLELFVPEVQQELWHELMDIAHNGSPKDKIAAIKLIFSYGYGNPRQSVDFTSEGRPVSAGIFVTSDFKKGD